MPVRVGLPQHVREVGVARRAQHQLAHNRPQLLIGRQQIGDSAQMPAHLRRLAEPSRGMVAMKRCIAWPMTERISASLVGK